MKTQISSNIRGVNNKVTLKCYEHINDVLVRRDIIIVLFSLELSCRKVSDKCPKTH